LTGGLLTPFFVLVCIKFVATSYTRATNMITIHQTSRALKIASRILVSAYNSPTATMQDCIDAENNFLVAERNHSKFFSMPKWHFIGFMDSRAEYYIKRGTCSRIGRRLNTVA
jgi:hypothetical protein